MIETRVELLVQWFGVSELKLVRPLRYNHIVYKKLSFSSNTYQPRLPTLKIKKIPQTSLMTNCHSCFIKTQPFKIDKFSGRKFYSIKSVEMADPNLVTTCNFHGQEFLFKMNVLCNNLEILVTDKNSGEEWQCTYDATCTGEWKFL